jgi:enoyl-CoA hydratase/carnithine racemase
VDGVTAPGGDTGPVRVGREGGLLTVELAAPPAHTLDDRMQAALAEVIALADRDDSVRAVALRGGDRIFCAGADVRVLAGMGYEQIVSWNRRLQRLLSSIAELPVPVVAAVTGHALGGGLELALCADYRVASRKAKLGLPEVQLGIMPGSGGTQRLTEIVGRSRAKELLMTGRHLTADEAVELGVVDEVMEPEAVWDRAVEVARSFGAGPRFAVRAIKEAVDHASGDRAGFALERALIAGLFATRDREIGLRSFLEEGPGKARFT